jgi:23S rRNA pseudouridine2457 synthase
VRSTSARISSAFSAPGVPPIRFRASIPDTWLSVVLVEGRNRQVRRMTAAIGYPTLRLVRVRIGGLWLGELEVGQWRELGREQRELVLKGC